VLAACAGDDGAPADPCAGAAGTCVALHVTSTTIARVDALELDVSYADRTGTATTVGAAGMPADTAIAIDLAPPFTIGVVVAGHLGDATLGTGFAGASIDGPTTLDVVIEPPTDPCAAQGFYCGDDKVAGDPHTLYRCADTSGGMAYARGICAHGCTVAGAGHDDTCSGGAAACVAGSAYCGGDKIDGDPRTLYTCTSGNAGTVAQHCPGRCLVEPSPSPDRCE
jgi:hypothetical protein